jgi:hypothetical protein
MNINYCHYVILLIAFVISLILSTILIRIFVPWIKKIANTGVAKDEKHKSELHFL